MCQVKKEEEELPALSMHEYNESKTTLKKRKGKLITSTRNNTDNTNINRTKITRKQKWEEKQLYRHFKRQTSEISHEKT